MKSPIILASGSSYKRALFERLRLPFSVLAANIDETPGPGESAESLVERLSRGKAQALAKNNPDQWILGCDQCAHLNGQLINKPVNHQTAVAQLLRCSGQIVEFITGVTLLNQATGQSFYASSKVQVEFITLSLAQIEGYLKADKPYDCAGSFKVESLGIALFKRVTSEDPTSLEGLPLVSVCQLLRRAGLEPLDWRSG